MIRLEVRNQLSNSGIPRESGDDPENYYGMEIGPLYSSRERG